MVATKLSLSLNSGPGNPAARHSAIISRVPVPMRSILHADLLENDLQRFVRHTRLLFKAAFTIEFPYDLLKRSIGLRVAGVDVAARGDIVIVFLQFGVSDDAAEFFFFLPL